MHSIFYSLFVIHFGFILFPHQTNGLGVRYNSIVIFGDSNSDPGNVFNMTNFLIPPSPYYKGRYSNGPVWSEKLNFPNVRNYAYGGATTDNELIQGYTGSRIPVPGVRQQIVNYSRTGHLEKVNFNLILYVIWAGGNNYIYNPNGSSYNITKSLLNATNDLISLGAKHIVLFNQVPLGAVPYFRTLGSSSALNYLVTQFNSNFSAEISILQNKNKDKTLEVFDLYSLISDIISRSSSYGISNTVDRCWNGSSSAESVCANPDSYVFFDGIHFTSRIHQFIANKFQKYLSSSADKFHCSSFMFLVYIYTVRFLFL